MTLLELLEFLRLCHKKAPFLNFNGNVFGEIARQIVAISPLEGIRALLKSGVLKPGDTVSTLKFTARGKIKRVLPDGRVAWVKDGRKSELLAMPESLIRLEPGQVFPDLG